MTLSTKAAKKLVILNKARVDYGWVCFCIPMDYMPLGAAREYVWQHITPSYKESRLLTKTLYAIKLD